MEIFRSVREPFSDLWPHTTVTHRFSWWGLPQGSAGPTWCGQERHPSASVSTLGTHRALLRGLQVL